MGVGCAMSFNVGLRTTTCAQGLQATQESSLLVTISDFSQEEAD